MRKELLVPVDGRQSDWPRKVANSVNYLLKAASDAVSSVATLTAADTALGVRVTALEAVSGVALAHPFVQLAAAPSTPTEGQTYYDTVLHKARTWDGTLWQNFW